MNKMKSKMSVTIWTDISLVKRIDSIADKCGISRSKLLSYIVAVSIDEMEKTKSYHRFALNKVVQEFRKKIKSNVEAAIQ